MQADNVCASAWQDRKTVMAMYTGCDPTKSQTVKRRQKDGSSRTVPCPTGLANYNKFMGGVDLGDQLRGYYHIRMKCRKFYKYIANFFFDVSVTNAFILYRIGHPGTKVAVKKFREVLAKQLIGSYCSKHRAGRGNNTITALPLSHFPTKQPGGSRKRGKCSLCKERKVRADTTWFCRDCGVWLCHPGTPTDCFLQWHRRQH